MDIFKVLTMIGGLCLFLFGMNLMGQALERRAGNSLRSLIGRMTDKAAMGFLTGLGVTAIIQSSSATTVMVVGFVWADLLTNLERTSDHCSNIAGCVIDIALHHLNLHETLRSAKLDDGSFRDAYRRYTEKYALEDKEKQS